MSEIGGGSMASGREGGRSDSEEESEKDWVRDERNKNNFNLK